MIVPIYEALNLLHFTIKSKTISESILKDELRWRQYAHHRNISIISQWHSLFTCFTVTLQYKTVVFPVFPIGELKMIAKPYALNETYFYAITELQIRGDIEDNLKIIFFLISQRKPML